MTNVHKRAIRSFFHEVLFRNDPLLAKIFNHLGTHILYYFPHLSSQLPPELLKPQVCQVVEELHVQKSDLSPLASQVVQTVNENISVVYLQA